MIGPCMCGDPYCPSCGPLIGGGEMYNKDLVEMTLEIYTSNDAFVEKPNRTVAQTLRRIANKIESGGPEIDEYIKDLNGNRIGNYCLEINEDHDE